MRGDYGPPPIYITENGAAFEDPPVERRRATWTTRAAPTTCAATWRRCAQRSSEGVDVRRYCLWSLLDNFEWEHGYDMRFGIVHVDYDSQRRVPKRSGLWYRDYIHGVRNGGVREVWHGEHHPREASPRSSATARPRSPTSTCTWRTASS